MAFDYLLRFYVQRLNRNAITRPWIANLGVEKILKLNLGYSYDIDTETIEDNQVGERAQLLVMKAVERHTHYLKSGKMNPSLLTSAIHLAQLDAVYRSGYLDDNEFGSVHEEDLKDLRKLMSLVDPRIFRAKHLCMLNPTFGKGSRLVGKADADLLIDHTLMEIKTTKNLVFQRRDFNQLLGYFALHHIGGIGEELKPKPRISRLAIYFSRHAYLHAVDVAELVDPRGLRDFLRWFKKRADEERAQE